ncbi:hypothetical protein [Salipiger sp. PrR003]|uniref:hypothetical protein n=1 Tax=Salipiger sp. PrR003 TaxID=2706776 RepID=UPI0013DB9F6C|nr:hypothetical protein [Salipiger sp. PrR003]NDV52824.1 hypothetical protein [Salipiger sp. PrR003]
MFLADALYGLVKQVDDPEFQKVLEKIPHSGGLKFILKRSRALLEDFDLYTFERSALIAASDLRADRQAGLEAIAGKVLEKPKKIYLEANWKDRRQLFAQLPRMPEKQMPVEYGEPVRVGIALECKGGGKATLQTVWSHPQSSVRDLMNSGMMQSLGCHKRFLKPLKRLFTMNWSFFEIDIDMSRATDMTKEDFLLHCEKVGSECWEMLQSQKEISEIVGEKSVEERAFALYRLNQICAFSLPDDAKEQIRDMLSLSDSDPNEVLATLRGDLDGEVIYGIAMAAVMELEGIDVASGPKPSRSRDTRRKKQSRPRVRDQAGGSDKLGVVSLDIDPKLVEYIYNGGALTHGRDDMPQSTDGKRRSPIAHPVKGHPFTTRSGEIRYRVPHWRGKDLRKRISSVR